MKRSSWLLKTSFLCGLALVAAPVAAQDVATDAGAEDTAEDGSAIRDIIVTAQKREDSIQSIPLAVSALDQQALDAATAEDLRDFAGRVPSLVVDSVGAGPSAAAISIRGISF